MYQVLGKITKPKDLSKHSPSTGQCGYNSTDSSDEDSGGDDSAFIFPESYVNVEYLAWLHEHDQLRLKRSQEGTKS